MGGSYRPQSIQTSNSSDCLLNIPFEAYHDSPTCGPEDPGRTVEIPRAQVGPSTWRKLTSWLLFSRKHQTHSPFLLDQSLDKKKSQRSCCWRFFSRSLLVFFVMLGFIQFILLAFGIVLSFFPNEYDRAASTWKNTAPHPQSIVDASHWPTDQSREIIAVNCHSHNDYWRQIPLFSALEAGCIGVEADVWLFDDELYVGHTTSSLTSRRTLRSLYIDPLMEILEKQNPSTPFNGGVNRPPHGVFDTDPDQSVIFLIDFKTDGALTWPAVVKQLAPLRDRGYLTYFNGQDIIPGLITVVGTGNTPFDLVTANSTYRDIFFDAPLEKLVDEEDSAKATILTNKEHSTGMGQGHSGMPRAINANTFNLTNSYYASVSFKKAVGFPWPFHFTQHQMDLIRKQVRVAHQHGLKVRYWSIPGWPISLRNHIWRILAQEGVDILNVDDLAAATKTDWKIGVFDWWL